MDEAPELEEKEPTRREWTGFWSLIALQTQNAFNDKAAQFLLIPLGGWIAGKGSVVEQVAGLMITLPYVLFAPLAGWMSDRFPKRHVMLGTAVFQAIVLAGLCAAIAAKNLPLAMLGFFGLATQAAFISPAKLGIIKELVGSRRLGFASGIQQMTAMLAILIGQIAAGIIFSDRLEASNNGWQAAFGPLAILAILSIPGIFLIWGIPRTPPGNSEPLTPALTVRHIRQLGDLWRDPVIRRTSFGIAFFWGFAGFINLWSIGVAKELTDGGVEFGRVSSKFMAAASLGMVGGFGTASMLMKRRIELGWVPVAGVAMTLSSLVLALVPFSSTTFLVMLAATAFFAAIFLTPLNAFLQDRCPPGKRGELLAAANLQDCLAGTVVVAVLLAFAFARRTFGDPWWLGLHAQLLLAATACGAITIYIARLIPADLVRVVGLSIIRMIYRIRSTGTDHFPQKGGVLLLPNHITWADAFFLTAACPRPVRFVMEAGFTGNTAVRVFSQLFDTVPINSTKPREALRASADALKEGHVVCIFPEGQLTRTGTLHELKRGFEIIARQAGCPLVPTWIDGAWGSIFSFEGNRFFTKFPKRLRYGISVGFAPPMAPENADIESIRRGMLEASAMALAERSSDPAQANALQLAHVNALQRSADFGTLDTDPLPDSLPALSIFEKYFGAIRRSAPYPDPSSEAHWLGGNALRDKIESSESHHGGVFFDFSDRAIEPLADSSWQHCPCLAIGGVIIAMSMPDPPKAHPGSKEQVGSKPDSHGILLPGFWIDGTTLRGPAVPDGLPLPDGTTVDEESFVFLPRPL